MYTIGHFDFELQIQLLSVETEESLLQHMLSKKGKLNV